MPAPKPPKAPRLRLHPIRSSESLHLDGRVVRPRGTEVVQAMPEFEWWPEFYEFFGERWNTDLDYGAEHVVLVGQAGSGKTRLAVELLDFQEFVIVLGTKTRDPSLYDPLLQRGYVIVDKFDPTDLRNRKVIFRPPLEEPTKEALIKQAAAFHKVLTGIFSTGGWCVYMDEVRYLTETLNLGVILNTLWLQGRSLWVTMVAATQRPVSIPLNAFEQATHSFLFRITGREDRVRASEYQGISAPVVFETLSRLPHHEFLYVDKIRDYMVRSQVQL
jgi:hypothetical protein